MRIRYGSVNGRTRRSAEKCRDGAGASDGRESCIIEGSIRNSPAREPLLASPVGGGAAAGPSTRRHRRLRSKRQPDDRRRDQLPGKFGLRLECFDAFAKIVRAAQAAGGGSETSKKEPRDDAVRFKQARQPPRGLRSPTASPRVRAGSAPCQWRRQPA